MKVMKPKKNYIGSLKNGLVSRSTKDFTENSIKPESCKLLVALPKYEFLEKCAGNMYVPLGKNRCRSKPKNIEKLIPLPEAHLVYNING